MKKQLALPSAFIVFGCMIVVSSVNGRNVDNAKGPFEREMIKKLEAERGEGPPAPIEPTEEPAPIEPTEEPAPIETTDESVPSDEVPEGCLKMDNDICLRNSDAWNETHSCSQMKLDDFNYWCWMYAKDTKRCCPNTCVSIQFTEEQCNSYWAAGNCTYPYPSTCHPDLTTGGADANACPEGSNILNPIECEEAAVLLDFKYVSNGILEDYPKGCYMHESFWGTKIEVYFNSHPIGAATDDSAPLCVKENSEIFSHLGVEEIEGEVEDCTTFMISQDEGWYGEVHEIRCIPEFLPCNCKNEDFKTKFNNMYLPCTEDIGELDFGMAYLCVHDYQNCMEAIDPNAYYMGLCMPDEKPSDCQDETWEELGKYKDGSNYGFPIETCPAPEPEDSDDDDGLTEPDVSDENVEVNEPDDSDEIDGETELAD